MPIIHPRENYVTSAEQKLGASISKIVEEHELTTAEELRILVNTLTSRIGLIAKYAIREERHPDEPGLPGCLG
jgi:hypothetical protein